MGASSNPAGWNDVYGFRPSQGRDAALAVGRRLGRPPQHRRADGAHRARRRRALLDVQSGWDARVPLSIAAKESYAAHVDDFEPRGVRIGWLGDLDGYLAMEPGIVELCARGLAKIEQAGGTVEPGRPRHCARAASWQHMASVWRRWSVAARIAPHLANPDNRARIKPEALWEYDQGQGLTGMQTRVRDAPNAPRFDDA